MTSLPTMNHPTYELTLPSNGKKVVYRPFVVKERSILLLALQEEKVESTLRAIAEIINICTFGVCKLNEMPIVDAEYVFINVRNKSVGEDLDVVHSCSACNKDNEVKLSLDKIVVEGVANNKDIDFGNGIFLKMKYPSLTNTNILSDNPTEDSVLNIIASCIDCIIEGDKVHRAEDNTIEELIDFVLGLTQQQLNKIENFFATMPKIVLNGKYTCKCGVENEFKLEGLENFFD